ncbi:alpha/beta hydrolase [Planktothrix sp.]|uniref:alpha/beta hydrolase n=1 Tax=Planktothrix sp. TaxID=3088171 RepID=UPI0038D41017
MTKLLQLCLGIGSGLIATTHSALAAETIALRYNISTAFISVQDLETFAKTGDVSPILSIYGKVLNVEDAEKLRQLLLTPMTASPWSIQQFNNSSMGMNILTRFGNFIQTDNGENGVTALKTAINQASKLPGGLTLLGVLQKFPGETLQFDINFAVDVIRDFSQVIYEDQSIINWINQQAKTKTDNPAINNQPIQLKEAGTIQWKKETFTYQHSQLNTTSPVDVYIPQISTPTPVIVISHGLGSDRTTFTYLAEHLASHGYFVAVPEHLETSANGLANFLAGNAPPPGPEVFINRPLDITTVLNLLEEKQKKSEFPAPLLLNNVGVLGQSYGGYTALAVGGAGFNISKINQECEQSKNRQLTLNISILLQCQASSVANKGYNLRDERVQAIIAINPITSVVFGQEGMSQIEIPVLMIGGSDDYIAPAVPEQIYPFSWLTNPNKYLILLGQGTHFSFLEPGEKSVLPVPPELIGPEPELAFPYLKAISLVFFNAYIRNQTEYLPYLNAGYIQRQETSPFSLSIVNSLTQDEIKSAISQRR